MSEGGRDDRAVRSITLASAIDLEGFRRSCRTLWSEQVAPERVSWHTADDSESDLFESDGPAAEPAADGTTPASATPPGTAPPVMAPSAYLDAARSVVLHADPARFGLLYRLLWRLQIEPGLKHDPIDADWVQVQQMSQAVRRDMHKMKAFVRFRTVLDSDGEPTHVAWFEPEHHTVEATAPFFARRFAQMRWAILTPERSVRWDGSELVFGPGGRRDQAPPADAGEQLWLTYYQSIFNPARLKLRAMQKEMPKRYWPNLPEGALIEPLALHAAERTSTMIASDPSEPRRPRAAASARPTTDRDVSRGADVSTLGELRGALERCRECPIGEFATQAVAGEGPASARLMFVGEQPGDQEDLQGRPFVGPAGQLFARALGELGIARDQVYITNAVKHFKFELRGKRRIHKTPSQQDAEACLHWLESEIALVAPAALVALGATAARQLMGRAVAVTRERGNWLVRSDGRRVLIALHPSALLRMEPEERDAAYANWVADLRHAQAVFERGAGASLPESR